MGMPGFGVSGRRPFATGTLPMVTGKMHSQQTSVIGLTNRPSQEGSAAALRLYPHNIRALRKSVRVFTETSLFYREGLNIQPFTGRRRRDPRRDRRQAKSLAQYTVLVEIDPAVQRCGGVRDTATHQDNFAHQGFRHLTLHPGQLVGIVTKIDKVSRDAVGKQLLALSTGVAAAGALVSLWAGFGALAFAAFMAYVVVHLPPADNAFMAAYQPHIDAVFGNTWRIVAGSMVAFACGSFANSFVLAKMKVGAKIRFDLNGQTITAVRPE